MNRLGTGACLLLMAGLFGCEKGGVEGLETHDFKAHLLADGSLQLQFFRNSKLSEETLIVADRISSANSVSATHCDEPGLGPWCIVECHINPSTSMIVAWNPRTDVTFCSPGYAWGMISSYKGDALVTIFRPHFNTPPDAPDAIHANGIELATLPSCGWKVTKADAAGVRFRGTRHRDEPASATVAYSGEWRSPTGKSYDVFCLHIESQMITRDSNVLGSYRVFFVRDGKVVKSTDCSGEICVQGNQLLEINAGGAGAPWPEADVWTKGL